ncbi:Hypothetical protein A7982_10403 [Minicystis rosea]|nr:Hypothetical protein A7982_10403 [Minicystis rosea]
MFDELDRFARGGEISHALALTYGYDGDTAAERIWTPLIEKYGVRHPVVIASGAIAEGTALGVHVLRMPRTSGVFHPKLFLAIREDAVLVAMGSANLTRGGLGANLEMLTPLVFSEDTDAAPPRAVLEGVLGFLRRIAADLEGRIDEGSRAKVLDVIELARVVLEGLPEPRRAPDLRFLHSYEEPLWAQIAAAHGDDAVTHLAVVSPFFEVDDPALDESDSLLRYSLGDGLSWAPRAKAPRCTLHVAALGQGMGLPCAALAQLGAAVELRPQALSIEPRRLHAKLFAIFGRRRTTLVWGSPNFTPAALLRSAGAGGNVECALLLTTNATLASAEEVLEAFDLGEIFHVHRGALPEEREPLPEARPIFEIGEAIYDGATHRLTICGEVWSGAAARLRVFLDLGSGLEILLADEPIERTGTLRIDVEGAPVEEIDPETGKRRLRAMSLRFEALDASSLRIAESRARLNVCFEDALSLRDNLLLGAEAATADALLVPSSAPPEARAAAIDGLIAMWKAARRGEGGSGARHQASLDGFFRNVRRGLDARWEGIERRRGSRFTLLRWSHDLRRALAAAGAEGLDSVRRAYLVARVAEHIERVLVAVPRWHADPMSAYAVVGAEALIEALGTVVLSDVARPEIGREAEAARARALAALRVASGDTKRGGNDA